MPRTGQIIPNYTVPHVATYINNNTETTEVTTEAASPSIRFLCVFGSRKGEDGVVKNFNNYTDFVKEYGEPDFKTYGQANLMPYALLNSGNASVQCLRVTATGAEAAKVIVAACVKKIAGSTTEPITPDKLSVKFEVAENTTAPTEAATDGYWKYPIFTVTCKGKGEYGNKLSFALRADEASNKLAGNNYINHTFELHDLSSGTNVVSEQFSGSLNESAVSNRTSLFLDDVINDPTNGSKYVKFETVTANFEAFYEKCNEFMTPLGSTNIYDIDKDDLLHGKTKAGASIANFEIVSTGTDVKILDSKTGDIELTGGKDKGTGTLSITDIETAIADAFTNNVVIRSKRRTPVDIILDANYSVTTKAKLIACAAKRGDAVLILDSGVNNETAAAVETYWNDTNKTTFAIDTYENNYIFDKECQWYKTHDPITGKIIKVTITYFMAQLLPNHFLNIGRHIPFVGADYATLVGNVRNTLTPSIDADDLVTKELLYTNRINFFEAIAEDTYARATQVSAIETWSDLSELNNVAVLLNMKRLLEDFITRKLYNFASAEDRVRFTESADRLFSDFRNRDVSSYDVYFDMNQFEEDRNILHCYLAIVFRALGKRCIVEIDINKRSSTTNA